MKILSKLLSILIISLSALGANATVIDFNSHATDGGNPIGDSGFRFTFSASGWGVFGPGSGACCNINYNGTTSLFADGNSASVQMSQVDGGVFDIYQFDASVYWTKAVGLIDLIGAVHGGGSVSATFNTDSTWSTFALSGFTNLDSLAFRDTQQGGFLEAPGFGIDNISTNPTTVEVPEPASLALFGLGLVGLVVARRRKQ